MVTGRSQGTLRTVSLLMTAWVCACSARDGGDGCVECLAIGDDRVGGICYRVPQNWQRSGCSSSEGGACYTLFSEKAGGGGERADVRIRQVGYGWFIEISESNMARAVTIGGLRVTPCAIGGYGDNDAVLTYILDDVDGTRYSVMIDGNGAVIRRHWDCLSRFLGSMRRAAEGGEVETGRADGE